MEQNVFNAMELDAIGEVMNISLGSSATAVSNLLDHRVDITTPSVDVVSVEDFTLGDLEPAIAVEIKYVSGLEGSNIMLLKRHDVKVIVDILMGTETPDEEFELNELSISAVCEVMNQMMGAASTALSDFIGRPVNISTPKSFTLDDLTKFKNDHFQTSDGLLVVVRFMLKIENILNSEFVNVMSVDLARELLGGFGMDIGSLGDTASAAESPSQPAAEPPSQPAAAASGGDGGGKLSQEEIERLMGGAGTEPPAQPQAPAAPPQAAAQPPYAAPPQQPQTAQPQYGVPVQQPMYAAPQYAAPGQPMYAAPMQPQYAVQPPMEPRVINTRPLQFPTLDVAKEIGQEQAQNLELIMSVPLEVSVEIGRTRRKVEDILTFSKGSLVVLDKLAGDQVDLFVNGLCVARGDVVVVDDNFGVRITEVLKQPQLMDLAKKG